MSKPGRDFAFPHLLAAPRAGEIQFKRKNAIQELLADVNFPIGVRGMLVTFLVARVNKADHVPGPGQISLVMKAMDLSKKHRRVFQASVQKNPVVFWASLKFS